MLQPHALLILGACKSERQKALLQLLRDCGTTQSVNLLAITDSESSAIITTHFLWEYNCGQAGVCVPSFDVTKPTNRRLEMAVATKASLAFAGR